jgi:hypothetical protein
MKRNTMLKIINPILGLFFLNQILTGFFHKFLSYELFELIHQGGGVILLFTTTLHLILNWNWVKANYFSDWMKYHQGKKT